MLVGIASYGWAVNDQSYFGQFSFDILFPADLDFVDVREVIEARWIFITDQINMKAFLVNFQKVCI